MKIIFKLINVSKKINDKQILNDINISLDKGKIYGLTGKNASGKTMFLKIIAGLINKDTGSIESNLNTIDYIIGKSNYLKDKSILYNLVAHRNGVSKEEYNKIIDYLNYFDLYKFRNKKIKNISTGMKQKVGIIDVFLNCPDLLILDEPFNGLDDASVVKLKDLIYTNYKDKTVIITSHDLNDLKDLVDTYITINEGSITSIEENTYARKVFKQVTFEKNNKPSKCIDNIIMQKNACILTSFILACILSLSIYNAFANNNLNKAIKLYNNKKYAASLEKVLYTPIIYTNKKSEYINIKSLGNFIPVIKTIETFEITGKDIDSLSADLKYLIESINSSKKYASITKERLNAYNITKDLMIDGINKKFNIKDKTVIQKLIDLEDENILNESIYKLAEEIVNENYK